jgi:hypothetical protein
VAVDWSGAAAGAARHIWTAHVRDGELCELRNGRSREEVINALAAFPARYSDRVVVALDFSFSFPAWFLRERGCRSAEALWDLAADEGEQWLDDCAPPFWGRPGRPRPERLADQPDLRATEARIAVGAIGPKSVFQIGGAGSVGTGTIRGLPFLRQLRAAGFAIWPFHAAERCTVIELYPRLFTGPVHKRNADARAAYVARSPWRDALDVDQAAAVVASEDAFDAAWSALGLYAHWAQLVHDLCATDGDGDESVMLEGTVWQPPRLSP